MNGGFVIVVYIFYNGRRSLDVCTNDKIPYKLRVCIPKLISMVDSKVLVLLFKGAEIAIDPVLSVPDALGCLFP